MPSHSPEKNREYQRRWRQRHPEKHREDVQKYRGKQPNTHARRAAFIASVKAASSCVVCGESDTEVLEYHHVEPKSFGLASASGKSRAAIEAEMRKCVIVCANCHKRLHAGTRALTGHEPRAGG